MILPSPTRLPSAPAPTPLRGISPLREAPRGRDGLVDRPRLLQRLLATANVRIVLVDAPAGYGKTTLLHAWANADPRPFHWLALDRGPRGRSRSVAELSAIARRPERLAGPFVLVVDGVRPTDSADVDGSLARIAEAIPPGSLLVMASRCALTVPVARLRAEHDVLELGARDLAMTHGEAAALLRASGITLGREALDLLLHRSEGWPAALSLAAQALADEPDPDLAVGWLRGDDPFIADYVRDEVLAPLSPAQRRFVLRSAVLETVEGELCDAVLDERRSAAMIYGLVCDGLPVTRLDRPAARVRYHPLLRETLLAELGRTDPACEAAIHGRAADWFDEHGDAGRAVDHALAAGDLDGAGRLLWRLAPSHAFDGQCGMLECWLAKVPARQIERHAALALTAATAQLARGDLPRAEHWALLAAQALHDAPPSMQGPLGDGLAVLAAATGRAGVEAMRRDAGRAAQPFGDASPWRAVCCLLEGTAAQLSAGTEAGRALLEEGVRRAAVVAPGIAALCEAELALAALCDEDIAEGACLAERARSRVDAIGLDDHAALALVPAVSALARAHRGRYEEAGADLAIARRLAAGLDESPAWYAAQVRLAMGRAELRLSDIAAARSQIAEAWRLAARLPDAAMLGAWAKDARRRTDASSVAAQDTDSSLTTAELRVMNLLPSHLSFREIGEILHVSANTIKSQAHAVYRKLGASSRSAAVDRAEALGLLDPTVGASLVPGDALTLRSI